MVNYISDLDIRYEYNLLLTLEKDYIILYKKDENKYYLKKPNTFGKWFIKLSKNILFDSGITNKEIKEINNIRTKFIYQEKYKGNTIILVKFTNPLICNQNNCLGARDYIKKLLKRNDLESFFRATNKVMLYSKTTSKQVLNVERLLAYAGPILKFAKTLYDGIITINAYKGLKVNYYSLNPKDLYDSLEKVRRSNKKYKNVQLEDIDINENTLHLDMYPQFEAYNNEQLILTFCIIRGINGYDETMGKTLWFPNITENKDFIVIPQDDNNIDLDICIFLSDVVEHGSTKWNTNNPIVANQFKKVQMCEINDEPWQPARMSITIPISFETNNPKQLWKDIQQKLSIV